VEKRNYGKYLGSALVLAGLGLAIYSLIALSPLISDGGLDSRNPRIGKLAPDFSLIDLSGSVVRLGDLRGKPVVINFWATWCGPCVIEMPNLQKYYETYPGEFELLAVDADEPEHIVNRFVSDIGVTFKVLLDPGANIQELYSIRGYPTTYFVNSNGVIHAQHIGMLTEQQIQDYLLVLGIGQ